MAASSNESQNGQMAYRPSDATLSRRVYPQILVVERAVEHSSQVRAALQAARCANMHSVSVLLHACMVTGRLG